MIVIKTESNPAKKLPNSKATPKKKLEAKAIRQKKNI